MNGITKDNNSPAIKIMNPVVATGTATRFANIPKTGYFPKKNKFVAISPI